MQQKRGIDLTVGLFVLGGLAALVFLALRVGNLSTASVNNAYHLYAEFDNIGGLKLKAPVTMAGVNVGRVTDVKIDKEFYTAVVELSIDANYDNLPEDSSAAILTAGLLGAQYVGLEPGAEESYLTEGDKIEITQSSLVLENLISTFVTSGGGGGESAQQPKSSTDEFE